MDQPRYPSACPRCLRGDRVKQGLDGRQASCRGVHHDLNYHSCRALGDDSWQIDRPGGQSQVMRRRAMSKINLQSIAPVLNSGMAMRSGSTAQALPSRGPVCYRLLKCIDPSQCSSSRGWANRGLLGMQPSFQSGGCSARFQTEIQTIINCLLPGLIMQGPRQSQPLLQAPTAEAQLMHLHH